MCTSSKFFFATSFDVMVVASQYHENIIHKHDNCDESRCIIKIRKLAEEETANDTMITLRCFLIFFELLHG
jgi:hypothetical protein